ncbi:MAG TPA: RidA family protein [Planctomycetes bacterium]|nr:RidA family protein [Planctomycetota bacterium]
MADPILRHLNPTGLHANPAFSQVVTVDGPHRLVVVGGQNAVDASGSIVGVGDLAAQTRQALANLRTALEAAGAGFDDVVRWTVYLVPGRDADPGSSPARAFAAAMADLGPLPHPPAITVLQVAGLAHPDFLVEIEALAAIPSVEVAR